MLTRRAMMAAGALVLAVPARGDANPFARLEAASGGRLGVAARDTASGRMLAYRAGERFAMCSTFKFLLAACVLQRIDSGAERPDRIIAYSRADLTVWSPETEKYAGEGMTVYALLDAILLVSDNTAANLLLARIGGPAGWTAFARRIGDDVSRLDRIEPDLNSAVPGDDRDTTTPGAMLENLQRLLIGEGVLPAAVRAGMIATMTASTTGLHRIRAGLPPGWGMADKTGSGGNGSRNDIGIIFPPGRPPILVAAYYTQSTRPDDDKENVLAEVGRMVAAAFGG